MSDHSMNAGATCAGAVKRSLQKALAHLDAAMRHFAEHGYEAARVGDMANQLGIAKGSVFQHFGSKDGLFFEAYKSALRSLPPYLDVPSEVRGGRLLCGGAPPPVAAPAVSGSSTAFPIASFCWAITVRT